MIVLVDRSLPGTLANDLALGCIKTLLPKSVPMHLSKRVVLDGEEVRRERGHYRVF